MLVILIIKKKGDYVKDLENLLKGFDKKKVASAMEKAKSLAQNPDVKKAFSKVNNNEVLNLLSKLDQKDKQQILNSIIKSNGKEVIELINKLK
jgi:hypothetical protein